jgi:hypothetical protein
LSWIFQCKKTPRAVQSQGETEITLGAVYGVLWRLAVYAIVVSCGVPTYEDKHCGEVLVVSERVVLGHFTMLYRGVRGGGNGLSWGITNGRFGDGISCD